MHNLTFTPEDWNRVKGAFNTWWAGALERPLIYLTATDPIDAPPPTGI